MTKRVVFSTDPQPPKPEKQEALPANPAAAVKARQASVPVRVHRDRSGRGGKTVSVIKGVVSSPAGKEALLKLLKTKLGTGGAIKGDDIEIQGEQRERILKMMNDLGYNAKVVGG